MFSKKLQHQTSFSQRYKLPLAFLLCIAFVVATYSILSLQGKVPMNTAMFLLLPFLLVVGHLPLMMVAWQSRAQLSLRARIASILWFGILAWYWFLSPLYYLLVINVNTLQQRWASFSFIWEVPFLGFFFVSWSLWRIGNLSRAMERVKSNGAARLYKHICNYPREIALALFVFTLVGYALGTVQLHIFAAHPEIEVYKSLINGLVISIHLGVFYFLCLELLLSPLAKEVRKTFQLPLPLSRSVGQRFFIVSLLTSLGSLALVSLFVVTLVQDIFAHQMAELMRNEFMMSEKIHRLPLPLGSQGISLQFESTEQLQQLQLAPETQLAIQDMPNGFFRDFQQRYKTIGWFTFGQTKYISLVYFDEYYDILWGVAGFVMLAFLFIVVLNGVLVFLYSRLLNRPLRQLALELRRVETEGLAFQLDVGNDDELTWLSEAMRHYVATEQEQQRVKDTFITVGAHRLRTPLGKIRWSLEQLMSEQKGKGKLVKSLQEVYDLVLEMIHVVNGMLQTARIEQGHLALDENQKVRVSELVTQAVKEVQPLVSRNTLTVETELPKDEESLELPRQTIYEIVINLLSNAAKYSTSGGSIHVGLSYSEDSVLLEVEDTGIGIPESEREHIFERFFRATNAVKKETEGSGLGLFLVQGYVRALGGNIAFRSRPSGGTIFSVRFPKKLTKGKI